MATPIPLILAVCAGHGSKGEAIGINTAIIGGANNIGFGVPISPDEDEVSRRMQRERLPSGRRPRP